MEKDNYTYINHILEFTKTISEFMNGKSKEDFLKDRMLQDAVIRKIEIIEEATKYISIEFKNEHDEIPWQQMERITRIILPDYFSPEINLVYETAIKWIPELKVQIEKLLNQ